MGDSHLYILFMINGVAIILDAALGYRCAPSLFQATGGDEEMTEQGIRKIRNLLAVVVAAYMFFNCYGLFYQQMTVLYLVMAASVIDMAGQAFIHSRFKTTKQ